MPDFSLYSGIWVLKIFEDILPHQFRFFPSSTHVGAKADVSWASAITVPWKHSSRAPHSAQRFRILIGTTSFWKIWVDGPVFSCVCLVE